MFKATITVEKLESTVDYIDTLVDECKIRLTEDGIGIRAVDPANVGMIDLELDKSAFEAYEATEGVIGINVVRLDDIISIGNSDDLVEMELDEETRKLHIEVDGLEYTLALIDPDAIREEPELPDLGLPGEVVIEGSELDRIVTASDMVSDHVALGIKEDDGIFYAEASGDTDDVELELEEGDVIDLDAAPAHSLFSLDYLANIVKPIGKKQEATMRLGEEFPTLIDLSYAEGDGEVVFMIAPRIQNN